MMVQDLHLGPETQKKMGSLHSPPLEIVCGTLELVLKEYFISNLYSEQIYSTLLRHLLPLSIGSNTWTLSKKEIPEAID